MSSLLLMWKTVFLMTMMMVAVMMVDGTGPKDYTGKVLLVSMDGFRWDYIKNVTGLGNFSRLAESGSSVDYVNGVFITVTYPAHYSIATGLYEESHGVVANNMYISDANLTFTLGYNGPNTNASIWWELAEPVWITAIKSGLKAGGIFWPGSNVEIHGLKPTLFVPDNPNNNNMPYEERISTAVNWLKEQDMQFVALHFDEPDFTGHKYGPFSSETNNKVREMDSVLGLLLNSLDEARLADIVNVIVTADHGMTEIDLQNRMIELYKVVDRSLIEHVADSGPVTAILPKARMEDAVMAALANVPHVTAYRKQDLPERYHYRDSSRIMPIIVVADEGWELVEDPQLFLEWNATGDHGYDNELPSMKPIFFARGPNFRKGAHITAIQSVDIYPLVCELLGIEPLPNNGTLEATKDFLQKTVTSSALMFSPPPLWLSLVFQAIVFMSLAMM